MVDWTFWFIQGEFLEEMMELSSLTSITPAWASQDYWCVLLVYCIGSIAISAYAQSSKVQTNSLYVWQHLENTCFQTFLEPLVSLTSSTRCSELWPKAAEAFLSADFPLSVCVMSTFHGKWAGLQFTLEATQPVGFVPTLCAFPQHVQPQRWRPTAHKNQQSQMLVSGLGKGCLSGRSCLQLTLQKASNNPK